MFSFVIVSLSVQFEGGSPYLERRRAAEREARQRVAAAERERQRRDAEWEGFPWSVVRRGQIQWDNVEHFGDVVAETGRLPADIARGRQREWFAWGRESGADVAQYVTSGSEREVETSSEELEEGEIPEERKKKKRRVVQSKRVTRMRKERTRWDGVMAWGVMRCSGCETRAATGCVVDMSGCENPRGEYHTPPKSCRRMWLCDECFAEGNRGRFGGEDLVCRGWWRNTQARAAKRQEDFWRVRRERIERAEHLLDLEKAALEAAGNVAPTRREITEDFQIVPREGRLPMRHE